LGAAIKAVHPNVEVELLEGGKGDFIVKVDGRELWNKKQMGNQFPAEDQILAQIQS
jgi:hypothetical protein